MHWIYIYGMAMEWNPEKNAGLKARYGFGFDAVVTALEEGRLLEDRTHPNVEQYGHQRQFIIEIEGYAWIVPYVQDGGDVFLKTMFPSRKATKRHLERK